MEYLGFETYIDFCFADFLITCGIAKKVRFHVKSIPWFVSDTTLSDFHWIIHEAEKIESLSVTSAGKRWRNYIESNSWIIEVDKFWTTPMSYYYLPDQTGIMKKLRESSLIIFKGDLNYRKLVYDCKWETTTPFKLAVGPLGEPNTKFPPIVALRTCKSDPVVGLKPGQAAELDQLDKEWRVNGKYGSYMQIHTRNLMYFLLFFYSSVNILKFYFPLRFVF